MWPILLDMTKVDCKRVLRRLELEAYGNLVSALRAQGGLNSEKHKLLQDLSSTLNIPQERHRAEIRRAVNDERLATIAYCLTGDDTTDEWAIEGRRLVPLMPRGVPQTAYSVIADDEANKASLENDKLPHPAATERKRPLQATPEPNKNVQYATNEFQKQFPPNQFATEDTSVKKRKTSMNMESSTLAQHLIMGPPKISRVQQLYRQKTKAMLKQQMKQRTAQQHISVQKHRKVEEEVKIQPQSQPAVQKPENKPIAVTTTSPVNNENVASTSKVTNIQIIKPTTTTASTTKVQQTPVIVNTAEIQSKSIKICPARKVITTTPKTQNQSQKLIIVSNSQGNSTTSSILQRTLTIPFKTISMKNLDKLKVITTASAQINSTTSSVTQKPKLLTVHTKVKSGTPGKQINIPFIQGVQLQALQNKGAIKMVPLSTTAKITSKSGVNTTGSVYIMNSNAISAVTSSNSSPIMTPKQTETNRNVYIIKNEEIKPSSSESNLVLLNLPKEQKSSVLSDILKASGVIPDEEIPDNEISSEQCDIETQISQLTAIPTSDSGTNKNVEYKIEIKEDVTKDDIGDSMQNVDGFDIHEIAGTEMTVGNLDLQEVTKTDVEDIENAGVEIVEEIHEGQEIIQFENMDEVTTVSETTVDSNYVILEDGTTEADMLVCKFEDVQQKENTELLDVEMMGNLDPETGLYSIQESSDTVIQQVNDTIIQEVEQDPTTGYVIEMESITSSELDMSNIGLN